MARKFKSPIRDYNIAICAKINFGDLTIQPPVLKIQYGYVDYENICERVVESPKWEFGAKIQIANRVLTV